MNRIQFRILAIILPIALFVGFIIFDCFYHADMLICDGIYQQLSSQSKDIKIITIDEESEKEYGKFDDWSRDKLAELTEILSEDPKNAPAIIAFDVMFIGDSDKETDERLKRACEKAGNVVCATNLKYKGKLKSDNSGNLFFDSNNIDYEEKPYEALSDVVMTGFANTCISEDNVIRFAQLFAAYNDDGQPKTIESFAYTVYRAYAQKEGIPVIKPKTSERGQTGFFYSGKPGEITHISIVDVLSGKIPASEFSDCVVFVGVYASGFQDAYYTTVARGTQMYGVEINANIFKALLYGKLATPISIKYYIPVASIILFIFLFIAHKQRLLFIIAEAFALIALHLIAGRFLAIKGYLIPQIYFAIILILTVIYFVIQKYVVERIKRKHALQTLKKYVAPQVVDELSKSGSFVLKLGGEKRDIAVLFVDVRGFTTMSESMDPEGVVGILNNYLSVTTNCVFKNEGTLDKFIGDATMAVFNAPFDLEDYIFKAVKTAWDIREGVVSISNELKERFGRTINVGIGVNCGEAVVGNIGCEFRMDYTAIGDTVNTAARLESNAKPGQILISSAVYETIKDRISAVEVGKIPLKGKSNEILVYSVTGFINEEVQ